MSITRYHFNSFNLGCHFAQGNEFQSMQPTIVEMVKASDYDALAAERDALLKTAAEHAANMRGELVKMSVNLSPAEMEGKIRDKLIELGWTPPAADSGSPR